MGFKHRIRRLEAVVALAYRPAPRLVRVEVKDRADVDRLKQLDESFPRPQAFTIEVDESSELPDSISPDELVKLVRKFWNERKKGKQ